MVGDGERFFRRMEDNEHAHEDVDVEVSRYGATIVPRSLKRRLTADGKALLADVLACVSHINQLEDELDRLVLELRDTGASWSAVGWAVGLSGEGARRRWGTDE